MKTKRIAQISIITTILFGLSTFYLVKELENARLEAKTASEVVDVCDENQKKLEKKLYYAEELLYEYKLLFPTTLISSLGIDTNDLNEMWLRYDGVIK